MNTKKKKKSKWKSITIIDENEVETTRIGLNEYGELPKGFYPNSRKSRLKHYYNTLGKRSSFFGNYKDPPNATSSIDVTNDSSTQNEEINKHTNQNNSINIGQESSQSKANNPFLDNNIQDDKDDKQDYIQKLSQNKANNPFLDNNIQDNKHDEQDDIQNLLSTDYFHFNDPFNDNWPDI